jgi:hypothetical protein
MHLHTNFNRKWNDLVILVAAGKSTSFHAREPGGCERLADVGVAETVYGIDHMYS